MISAQYIVFSMSMTAICLSLTLGILNLHHHLPQTPVPRVMRKFILHKMAACVCLHRRDLCCHLADNTKLNKTVGNSNLKSTGKGKSEVNHNSAPTNEDVTTMYEDEDTPTDNLKHQLGELSLPSDLIQFLRSKMAADEQEDIMTRNREQWEHCGRVLDRCLLILSLLVIACMSIVYGAIIAIDYEK